MTTCDVRTCGFKVINYFLHTVNDARSEKPPDLVLREGVHCSDFQEIESNFHLKTVMNESFSPLFHHHDTILGDVMLC